MRARCPLDSRILIDGMESPTFSKGLFQGLVAISLCFSGQDSGAQWSWNKWRAIDSFSRCHFSDASDADRWLVSLPLWFCRVGRRVPVCCNTDQTAMLQRCGDPLSHRYQVAFRSGGWVAVND